MALVLSGNVYMYPHLPIHFGFELEDGIYGNATELVLLTVTASCHYVLLCSV
jgi:hypothetical protein